MLRKTHPIVHAVTDANATADMWQYDMKLRAQINGVSYPGMAASWRHVCFYCPQGSNKSLNSFSLIWLKLSVVILCNKIKSQQERQQGIFSPASFKHATSLQCCLVIWSVLFHEAAGQSNTGTQLQDFLLYSNQSSGNKQCLFYTSTSTINTSVCLFCDRQTAKFGQLLFRQLRHSAQWSTPTGRSRQFHHLCWETQTTISGTSTYAPWAYF